MRSHSTRSSGRDGRATSTLAAGSAALLGVAWFLASGGGGGVDPGHVGWLFRGGDSAQHWLGWSFFRNEGWQWPLGELPQLAEPLGTSIAFTDAIPLIALAARPLSPLLPADVQFLGGWLAACFALQGFFGARVAAALGAEPLAQCLTGALFAVAPTLLWRVGHEALSAHWLLLGLIALAIRSAREEVPLVPVLGGATLLAVLAATIHPTLAIQALGLAFAVGASLYVQKRLRGTGLAGWFAAVLAADAIVFSLLGYLGTPVRARGFGYFGADLLTFVNPMGWSRFLPTLPTRTPGQGEGFAYLGVGGLALAALALLSRARPRGRIGWRGIAPLVAVVVAFAMFAVSTYVTIGGRKLFGTSSLPDSIQALVAPFRASGRFVWPLYYTLLAASVAGTLSLFDNRRAGSVALAGALALQIADIGTGRIAEHFEDRDVPALAGWEAARIGYRHLSILPPRVRDADGQGCGPEFGAREVALAYRAYRARLGVNSAYVSRMDVPRAMAACSDAMAEIARGDLHADTVYVPDADVMPSLLAAGAICGRLTGEVVCVAAEAAEPLRGRLARSR